MSIDLDLSLFKCSISKTEHIVENPIKLGCDHLVCKQCVLNEKEVLKCRLCNYQINKTEFNNHAIKSSAKINICFDKLISVLEEEAKKELNKLKNFIETGLESVDLQIEYISDEMEVRIESLKNQLDTIHNKFKTRLETIKNYMILFEKDKQEKASNLLQTIEPELNMLHNNAKENINKNDAKFYEYQNKILELSQKNQELEAIVQRIQLNLVQELDDEVIGKVIYTNSIESCVRNMLNQESFDTIQTYTPNDSKIDMFIPFRKKLILTIDFDRNIKIFDENFKHIMTVPDIDGKKGELFGIAANENDQIYISDRENHRVIQLDAKFKIIKSFEPEEYSENPFDPNGLYYKNGLLYVCDSENNKIHVLDKDLKFIESSGTDEDYECPLSIAVNDHTICINNYDYVRFFDIKTLKLRHDYNNLDDVHNQVNEINSYFYVYVDQCDTLRCFNNYGFLLHEMTFYRFQNPTCAYNLFQTNNGLYIAFRSKLIRLNKRLRDESEDLKSRNYDLKELNGDYVESCVLSNGNLVIGRPKSLELYDPDMKQIERMDYSSRNLTMNIELNREVKAVLLAKKNKIYVLSGTPHDNTLFQFDKDLKVKNQTNLQATNIISVCYKNDYFYFAYHGSKLIEICNDNLSRVKHDKLTIEPNKIKVGNEVFCATSNFENDDAFYVYELSTFNLKYKYNYGESCRIIEFNSNIYVVNEKIRKIYYHDANGIYTGEQRIAYEAKGKVKVAMHYLNDKLNILLFKQAKTS